MEIVVETLLILLIIVAFVLLSFILFAVWASRVIGPDSRYASIVCKLSYLLHLPVPRVEKAKFLLYPCLRTSHSRDSKDVKKLRAEQEQQKPLLFPELLDHSPSNDRGLVIALAGGAVRGIGALRAEFKRTLQTPESGTNDCDLLFVLDPSGMSFYSHKFAEVAGVVREVSNKYSKVLINGCFFSPLPWFLSLSQEYCIE